MAYIQFLGAAGTVTGSKHLINTSGDAGGRAGLQVLIDCGLFQGLKQWRERNWQDPPIQATEIDAVILTHAHLDHSGWIPRLVKEGFRGPIYCSAATAELCGILLPDSGHLQEEDAAFYNKVHRSKHDPALPLYTLKEAQDCLKYFRPVEFGAAVELAGNEDPRAAGRAPIGMTSAASEAIALRFRFFHASHILGSSMVQVELPGNGASPTLVFTGDIGRVRDQQTAPGKVVHRGPETMPPADLLVMESTYGNREHPSTDPRPELARLITQAVKRGGSVVVPAFAVERTQKFLFMIKEMMEAGQIPRVPVYADSPMAIKAMEVFLKHREEFTDETKALIDRCGSPNDWPGFHFATTPQESKKINASQYPTIIVSSSGMVTGGRVQHHLVQRLPDPKNLVLFIGFQALGTRGAIIKSGAKSVKIYGEEVPIRAQVAALEQFSDHADTRELLEWLHTFSQPPKTTYLVHGEPQAAATLKSAIEQQMRWTVKVAEWMEKVEG